MSNSLSALLKRRFRRWRGLGVHFSWPVLSKAGSRRQKRRGALRLLAIQTPKLSLAPPRAPPPSRAGSATSLSEQLTQNALLQVGRRALGPAPRPQELQEQLLEIVLLAAGRAVLQMLPDLPLQVGRELAVQEFVEMVDALATIHAGLPLMYPISTA